VQRSVSGSSDAERGGGSSAGGSGKKRKRRRTAGQPRWGELKCSVCCQHILVTTDPGQN
jgi:hypothetical protein